MPREHAVCSPWRRFLARSMDYLIYSFLWLLILRFVFGVNLITRSSFSNYLDTLMILLLMLLVEPALLQKFGTTAGKKALGIRVETLHGHRLSYWEGMYRTGNIISSGLGYGIPILNIHRLWRSYKRCANGEIQPWDEDISYSISDITWHRGVIYAAVSVVLIFAMGLTITVEPMPPNRGDLTIDEFAENFNYLASYYQINLGGRSLSANGQWDRESEEDSIICGYPEFFYKLNNGSIKEVGFELEFVNHDKWISSYEDQMILAALSFVGAQQDIALLSMTRKEIIKKISGKSFQDFEFEEGGITVSNEVEYSGYFADFPVLVPDESSEKTRFWMFFRMQKN